MKFVLLVCLINLLSVMKCEDSEMQVIKGNNVFASKMYKVLSEKQEKTIFSPISVHAALSMIYQGAKDSTANVLANAIHVTDTNTAADGYKQIMERINNVKNVTLHIANKVYVKKDVKINDIFKSAIVDKFSAEVDNVDFDKKTETVQTINNWVEQKTNNKIHDIVQENYLNKNTRLVVINAIYFKGAWAHPFTPQFTQSEPFYTNDNDKINVDMMHISKDFNYKEDKALNAKILQIPYANNDISMIVILPNERNGLKQVEDKLNNIDLSAVTQGLVEHHVNLGLPKFKIEQTHELKDALSKIGLEEIFDEKKANFKGIIDGKDLFVSKVIQKTFIEVNEEGSEAAAATNVLLEVVKSGVIYSNEVDFLVDHHFIFIITQFENNQQIPLFIGKM